MSERSEQVSEQVGEVVCEKIVGRHGIEYDSNYRVKPVKKSDYFDQNEMHVLLMNWKKQRLAGEEMPKLLRDSLWYAANGYMSSREEKMARLQRDNEDLWEDVRIKLFEHYLKTAHYYSPEDPKGKVLRDMDGNIRKPNVRVYYFLLLIARQITKCTIGKHYQSLGNTKNHKMGQNDFMDMFYGGKTFDTGGRKVGRTEESDGNLENIWVMVDESENDD